MTLITYSQEEINEWLGTSTTLHGRSYIDKTSDIYWRYNTLRGKVQDTELKPYSVEVCFTHVSKSLLAVGKCSCQIAVNCKHVAAILLAAIPNQEVKVNLSTDVAHWLAAFRATCIASNLPAKKSIKPKSMQGLVYNLIWIANKQHCEIEIFKTRLYNDGSIRLLEDLWNNIDSALLKPPQFVLDVDLDVFRLLRSIRSRSYFGSFVINGEDGIKVLEKILPSNRLFINLTPDADIEILSEPLRQADSRVGRLEWHAQPNGLLKTVLQTTPPSTMILETSPCWYVDASIREIGPVQMPFGNQSINYLSMPPVSANEMSFVAAAFREAGINALHSQNLSNSLQCQDFAVTKISKAVELEVINETKALQIIDVMPIPILTLDTKYGFVTTFGKYRYEPDILDCATLTFNYNGIKVDSTSNVSAVNTCAMQIVEIKRKAEVERKYLLELDKNGLQHILAKYIHTKTQFQTDFFGLEDPQAWHDFVNNSLPNLRKQGFDIIIAPSFRFNIIEIDNIEGIAKEGSDNWFDLEMGINASGRTINLEPLLVNLFKRDARWLNGNLENILDEEFIELITDSQEKFRIKAGRLKPVMQILVDLFDNKKDGSLRVSKFDAGRLEALNNTGRWEFHGDDSIRKLAQTLRTGEGLIDVPIPKTLNAILRSYQHQGLNWLQFLRKHNLSGILADDMGLGKTIQVLAHILAEQESNRLTDPVLIVVPTTLIYNWKHEAEKFAPGLKLLDLNGVKRKFKFEKIKDNNIILTTYALLWRDQKILLEYEYHLLILDEAQYVKNATTKAANTIRDIKARHRLCLTGTPLENHLGELWSQFDFLLPGFLGTSQDFGKRWRIPIEKNGDEVRRKLLARRIRPFMLRRCKDEVAKELPKKTTIIQTVVLEGGQRDLYETIRTAMQEKVREAISTQGFSRSHIVVLDALLKLRQVCCDPRLLKLELANKVTESAKLSLLMSMLPELIDEGRRVLLFSQFTGMLDLISKALNEINIPFVTLTGKTTNRIAPIESFQQGKVPLFLISLKAGGVGLNLTAADTVIHYDPWWNPSVENQATDRAHRIGQDKPVFVYKFIASGSIEEKIVLMQKRKTALIDGILSQDCAQEIKFSENDLQALFEPIPSEFSISVTT